MFKKLEEIEIWNRGCELAVQIYRLTTKEPFAKDWSLRDQLRRAAISIPSNIAEGYERNSQAEFKRFLNIAKGSCGELRTQLHIIHKLELLVKLDITPLIKECMEISSMIQSLASHIRSQQNK